MDLEPLLAPAVARSLLCTTPSRHGTCTGTAVDLAGTSV
jgi:hypothetical protein